MRYKVEACCLICKHGVHLNESKMVCDREVPTFGVTEVQPTWWCIGFTINPYIDAVVDR